MNKKPAADPRLASIRPLIKAGHIKLFTDIFKLIPPSVLARELKIGYGRMAKIMRNPGLLDIDTCYKIAELIEVKGDVVVRLVSEEVRAGK